MTDTPIDPLVGLHYKLLAYVCGPNCIQPPTLSEPATFTAIMEARPEKCRFAVAQAYRLRTAAGSTKDHPKYTTDDFPSGPIVVWDLFDDLLVRGKRMAPSGMLMPPPPKWHGNTEDGMVMVAMTNYDKS